MVDEVVRTVANRRRTLTLDDRFEVRLDSLAVRRRGGDRIVVAELLVRNVGEQPIVWPDPAPQVALFVGEKLVPQDGREQRSALAGTGAAQPPRVALAPGESGVASAGWRLPRSLAVSIDRRGSAIIVVPPHDGGESVGAAGRIGVLRLWK